jgi:hypothetical protein
MYLRPKDSSLLGWVKPKPLLITANHTVHCLKSQHCNNQGTNQHQCVSLYDTHYESQVASMCDTTQHQYRRT